MEKIRRAGHTPIAAPLFTIKHLPFTLKDITYHSIIMTSAHACEQCPQHLFELWRKLPFYCVGAKTAQKIRTHLPNANIICADTSAALIEHFKKHRAAAPYLYLTTPDRKTDIEHYLQDDVRIILSYISEAATHLPIAIIDLIQKGEIDCVLHYSHRSAEVFTTLAQKAGLNAALAQIHHIAISESAAQPLAQWPISLAAHPDEDGMITALNQLGPKP
jgi:uroporphyrinogen-III synthase